MDLIASIPEFILLCTMHSLMRLMKTLEFVALLIYCLIGYGTKCYHLTGTNSLSKRR